MISTSHGEPASKYLPIGEPPDTWDGAVIFGLVAMHLEPQQVYQVPPQLAEQILAWAERFDYHGTNQELAELGKAYKQKCPDPVVLSQLRRYYQDRLPSKSR